MQFEYRCLNLKIINILVILFVPFFFIINCLFSIGTETNTALTTTIFSSLVALRHQQLYNNSLLSTFSNNSTALNNNNSRVRLNNSLGGIGEEAALA
jgi:hypothetical protein